MTNQSLYRKYGFMSDTFYNNVPLMSFHVLSDLKIFQSTHKSTLKKY